MKRVWQGSARILVGLVIAAMYAMPQAYTISARPGVVNYIEGIAYVNGHPLSEKALRATFLSANDTLSTGLGKAEVLLTPGVFLRISDNSQIRMISPSLTDTQVEVDRGEAMIEAAGLMKENNIRIMAHGGAIAIQKDGLYRVRAGDPPTAAVLEGRAEVSFGDRKLDLGKGRETVIGQNLKAEKIDSKAEDDLYAWSNVRSGYVAAASYQSAQNVAVNNNYGGWNGFGFGGWYNPGWFWNSGFNSYAWLPGSGAFYSPFGWGFYGPGVVGYAPVVLAPVYGGGRGRGATATVPVNPAHPPAMGTAIVSPYTNQVARARTAQSFAASGFRTGNGGYVAAGRGSSGLGARSSGGSFSGGAAHASGGFSGGGAHSSGGSAGGSGGGHR